MMRAVNQFLRRSVIIARKVGAVVLAIAAVVVWFAMGPEDRSSDIRQALVEYEVNNTRTSGAPQQQVVNGWVAKDLLTIIAEQQDDVAGDERLPALVGLLVLGAALYAFTSPRRTQEESPTEPTPLSESEATPVLHTS
jgi:hypothetical protein